MLVPVTDSRGLSHSELFVPSRGLAVHDCRFRAQRISHKHTLHLCKSDANSVHAWSESSRSSLDTRDFRILIHVVFNFLESFIKWFADCSHCNQEEPFPTKETCLVSMIWSHLQQTLRVDQTCYWCSRLWRRLLVGVRLLPPAPLGGCRSIGSVPAGSCPSGPDIP